MSNINVLVRGFYDLALGCRGDALVPRSRTASSKIFAPPAPMRGNLLRASATKCSWPPSLSDRLGGASKTNACDISAPLCAIALNSSYAVPKLVSLSMSLNFVAITSSGTPQRQTALETDTSSRGRSIALTKPLFTFGTPGILVSRLLHPLPQELKQPDYGLVPHRDHRINSNSFGPNSSLRGRANRRVANVSTGNETTV